MSSHSFFSSSRFAILKREYMDYRRNPDIMTKPSKLEGILTQLNSLDKSDCPENAKESFAFTVEEFQLHILYTAIFISKISLSQEHEVSSEELLIRYKELVASEGYKDLKPYEAVKQKIDRYVSNLESALIQNQRVNVLR